MSNECPESVRLANGLCGKLAPEAEDAWQRHVEGCPICLRLAESWVEENVEPLADQLAPDPFDQEFPTDEFSTADFAVSFLEPPREPGSLGTLGGYDVVEIVGRGGMGIVLKAFDPQLKRCVAIKTLAPHLANNALARKRFAREAQAAAAVVHVNVIAIYQVQPQARLPYFVMAFLSGESLDQRICRSGPLNLDEVLRLGRQVSAGLSAAHEQGLIHRDVKPANILIEAETARVVLTDFGLARTADDLSLTTPNVVAGTPEYMSPETTRGGPIDPLSDLFSLGTVLYHAATGVSPFRAESAIATLRRLTDDTPTSLSTIQPQLPRWFAALVERLMEKESSKRFSSAREVVQVIDECLDHLQRPNAVNVPAVLMAATRANKKKRRWLMILGIASLTAAASLYLGRPEDPPEETGNPQSALQALGARVEETPSGLLVDIRSNPAFDDKQLDLVQRCPEIMDLTLEQVHITDAGLLKLRPLTRVERLILNNSRITGAGLENLAGLPLRNSVTSIGLRATPIQDVDLTWIRSFPNLTRIDLSQTVITDAGLRSLHGLSLDVINLSQTSVTGQGIEELRRHSPVDVRIQQ